MTRPVIRWLPFSSSDGPHHMAADEVLLESAVRGVASIRVYVWNPPTVSLGYFQRSEERLRDPHLARYPWVRRATGGGAIIHDGDLTYAIALPSSWLGGLAPACWHDRIHHVLAGILRKRHIPAEVAEGPRPQPEQLRYLCFAVPQPGDVLLDGVKIIGGAQRIRHGALMQHGSMQHARLREWADILPRDIAEALGWQAEPASWTADELARIDQLAREKYSSDSWNRRR
jgi:lipoate-protein ligase A